MDELHEKFETDKASTAHTAVRATEPLLAINCSEPQKNNSSSPYP